MVPTRQWHIWVIAAIIVILGVAVYLQVYDHLQPCPLCVFQRIAYVMVGIGALIAWVWYRVGAMRMLGWIVAFVFSLVGLGMALRQVWLQHIGPNVDQSCLPGLNYMYHTFSWFNATMMVLQGTSDCAKVVWRFLGLSMAGWSAACFALLALIWLVCFCKKEPVDVAKR